MRLVARAYGAQKRIWGQHFCLSSSSISCQPCHKVQNSRPKANFFRDLRLHLSKDSAAARLRFVQQLLFAIHLSIPSLIISDEPNTQHLGCYKTSNLAIVRFGKCNPEVGQYIRWCQVLLSLLKDAVLVRLLTWLSTPLYQYGL